MKRAASAAFQYFSVVVALAVAAGPGGGLVWWAFRSYRAGGSFFPLSYIEPAIGAMLVFALAVLIGVPRRVYRGRALKVTALVVAALLVLVGVCATVYAVALFQWSQSGENVAGLDVVAGATALLALAAAGIMMVKALTAGRAAQQQVP
ncbi:MAG: hypothetical protein SV910_04600 [Chloroflexota bacterium]|nr:hypothetical protein [Chloroflexota bacterium]